MGNSSKHADKLIDKVEELRSSNNKNWMDLLRLAYKNAPEETAELLAKIHKLDQDVAAEVDEILKVTKAEIIDNSDKS